MLRRQFLYIIVIGLAILYAILYNQYSSAVFFILVILLPLFSCGLLWVISRKISIKIKSPAQAVAKNQKVAINIEVENKSFLPVSQIILKLAFVYEGLSKLEKKNRRQKKINVSLDSKGEVSIQVYMKPEFPGKIKVHVKHAKIFDYLGLLFIMKPVQQQFLLTILPEVYLLEDEIQIDREGECLEGDLYSKSKSGDDPSEVFDIREYREGDKLQRIHWKLSLKKDQYMVKDLSLPIDSGIIIWIEACYQGRANDFQAYKGGVLECVLSLSYSLLEQEYMHYVAWMTKEGEYKKVAIIIEEDVYDMIEELLDLSFYQEEGKLLLTHNLFYPQNSYHCVIYITTYLSENIFAVYMPEIQSRSIQVLYIGNQEEYENKDQYQKYSYNGMEISYLDVDHMEESIHGLKLR